MQRISLKDILVVIQRTLNSIDNRMINHGEQVAYIMYKLLKCDNKYSEDEILRMVTVSIFHDIGAYKVEERKRLIDIDFNKPMAHAVYGSLFIKYFSPLSDLAPLVLGHHIYPKDLNEENRALIPKEALLLHLADNIAILQLNLKKVEKSWIMNRTNDDILPEHKELFQQACSKYNLLEKIKDDSYIDELYELFDGKVLSRNEIIDYVRMLTYAIDFRSKATILHTIEVEEISWQIAKLLNIDENKAVTIKISSMLHDIGKIAIPIEILEKPGKLTPKEYEQIKDHAIDGYKILSNLGIDDIRDIATLHHEKLDGTGYPFGLRGNEISIEGRVIAIADILSALVGKRSYKDELPKDTVISILSDMEANNKIDSKICKLVIEEYDFIMSKVHLNTKGILKIYNNLMKEYKENLEYFEKLNCHT